MDLGTLPTMKIIQELIVISLIKEILNIKYLKIHSSNNLSSSSNCECNNLILTETERLCVVSYEPTLMSKDS